MGGLNVEKRYQMQSNCVLVKIILLTLLEAVIQPHHYTYAFYIIHIYIHTTRIYYKEFGFTNLEMPLEDQFFFFPQRSSDSRYPPYP